MSRATGGMGGKVVSDNSHGPTWGAIADWRVRWVAVVVTIAIAATGAAVGYGSLKRTVDDVASSRIRTELDIVENAKELAKLAVEINATKTRLTDHVSMPVHSQMIELVGRLDERVKELKNVTVILNEKMDRLLLQRSSR